MILVDSSVWIDHFRAADATLVQLLESRSVVMHPFVTGEIALGNLRQRDRVLREMRVLPSVTVAMDEEVFALIARRRLFGLGIGYVDAHLLAAVQLTPGTFLWTRDRRLLGVAERMGLAATYLDQRNGAG